MSIFAILAVFVLSVVSGLFVTVPASASVKGRKTTAWALTGAAAYEVLRGKTGTGLLLGGGAAYAWKRTKDEEKANARHRHHSSRRHHHSYAYRR
jgi:hypothetical protein